jgi:hypothetical protein
MIGTAAALKADGLAALAALAFRISVCTLAILGTDANDTASSWNPTVETTDLPAVLKADDLFVFAISVRKGLMESTTGESLTNSSKSV